jgi:prepilin signal peptidase PulO-like enzyme (type II secretory pathway)
MLSLPIQPEFYPVYCVYAFVLGLFFGSFFNVCIYRLPLGMSINNPKRSFCFRCGSMVQWYDNLPVISYLLLKGRCRSCGSPYSARYMLIELLTGIIFLAVFMGTNPPGAATFQLATLWYIAFASLLIIGTFTDIDHYIIPKEVTLGGSIAAVVAAVGISLADPWPMLAWSGPFPALRESWGQVWWEVLFSVLEGPFRLSSETRAALWWEPIANSVIGGLFGFGMLWGIGVIGKVIFRKEAMGYGDVELFWMIGATLGVSGCLLTLMFASFFGVADGIRGKIMSAIRRPEGTTVLQEGLVDLPEAAPPVEGEAVESPSPEATALRRLVEIEKSTPRKTRVHYLPFGPSIALAALLLVIFQHRVYDLMARVFG